MLKKFSNFLIWLIALTPCLFWFQDVNRMVFPKAFIIRIFIELLLICYLFLLANNKIGKPKFNFINICFGIYILISICSGFWGVDPGHSFWSTLERYLSNFDYIHYWILLFILPCFLINKEKWLNFLRKLNLTYLGVTIFYYVCFLFNFFRIGDMNSEVGRWMGFAGNSIFMSVFLLVNIFISLYLFFEDVESQKKNYIFLISSALFTFFLFQTASRGSILSLAFSGFLLLILFSLWKYDKLNKLYHINNQKIGKIILISLVGICIAVFSFKDSPLINKLVPLRRLLSISSSDTSTANRLAVTRTSIIAFVQRPWFGWGANNYDIAYQNNFDSEMMNVSPKEFRFDKAHNMFLEVAVCMGVIGLLLYIMVYYSIHYGLKTMDDQIIEFFPKLILIFLVLSYGIQNLFVFDVFEGLIPFLIFISFVSTLISPVEKESKSNMARSVFCFVLIPFVIFSIYYFNIREIAFLNGYRDTNSYLREFTVLQDVNVLSQFPRPFTKLQNKILQEDREYILFLIKKYPTRWRSYVYVAYLIGLKYENKNIPKEEIDLLKQTYFQAKQYGVALPDYERQYNMILRGSADINDVKTAELNVFFLTQKYPKLDWKVGLEEIIPTK